MPAMMPWSQRLLAEGRAHGLHLTAASAPPAGRRRSAPSRGPSPSCSVKLPVISPFAGDRRRSRPGFEMIVRSTAIAIWFCGRLRVQRRRASPPRTSPSPGPLSWNVTTHCVTPVFGSLLSCAEAFVMSLPVMITGPELDLVLLPCPGTTPCCCPARPEARLRGLLRGGLARELDRVVLRIGRGHDRERRSLLQSRGLPDDVQQVLLAGLPLPLGGGGRSREAAELCLL